MIFVDKKKWLWLRKSFYTFIFPSKYFRRERERERARDHWWPSSSPVRRSPANPELQSAPISRAPVRRPWSEIVIDASRDRAVDRDLLAFVRSRSSDWSSQSTAPSHPISRRSRWWFFFLGFVRVLLGLSFPSSFPNTRKYFPENFLKCNQTHENIFFFGK